MGAFGIPSSSDLSSLANQLGTLVTGAETQEQQIIRDAISQIADHATALESQAAKDVQAIEAPIVAEIQALREEITEWRKVVAGVVHRAIRASAAFGAAESELIQ